MNKLFDIERISIKMLASGLSDDFVLEVAQLAEDWEGIYDLMMMWDEERDLDERQLILDNLEDLIKNIGD